MSPPHLASQIPWNDLIEHIQFAPEPTPIEPSRPRRITDMGKPLASPILKPDFQMRPASDDAARQSTVIGFVRAFVSHIIEQANVRISLLPKPDAWHTCGLVDDEQLFPPSLIDKMAVDHGNYSKLLRPWFSLWSPSRGGHARSLIIFALNYPENPYEHLPTLLYLAQHPRVSFSESRKLLPLGHGVPGLGSYASQTIARYLFVNLFDAMSGFGGTKYRTMGFTQRQRAWHIAVVDSESAIADERLHLPFWISHPTSVYNTAERQRYVQRCFDFTVSWYAIMREAAVKDWALGLTEVPAFGEQEFLNMVLDEMELICSVFKVDERPSIPVVPAPPTADAVEIVDLRTSPFTALPLELQVYIFSFLPRSSLLPVISVSRQMCAICRPILYADPLGALRILAERTWMGFELGLQNYMRRLVASLEANASTSRFLRCLHVVMPALDFWGANKASFLKDLLGNIWRQDVRELWLFPTYGARHQSSTSLGPGQEYRHGIYDIGHLFPGLSTLRILSIERRETLLLDPVEELLETKALPPLWNSLRHLTLHLKEEPLFLDVYWRMIASSASTLQSLHIETPDFQFFEENEWRRFPVCPNVREFSIDYKSPGLQALLLRCFPKLISLDLKPSAVRDDTLDLSLSAEHLEHVHFRNMFAGMRLPNTIKTVSIWRMIYCEAGGGRLGKPDAVFFGSRLENVSDNVRFAGEAWPGLLSLEMAMWVDLQELPALIATHLPRLESLILHVHNWSDRPRRMDYPADDGLDEEQRMCAASFFETCKSLTVISFNGIPGEEKKGKVPDRVWTRIDGGWGARMTVRNALKWTLSEYWKRNEALYDPTFSD